MLMLLFLHSRIDSWYILQLGETRVPASHNSRQPIHSGLICPIMVLLVITCTLNLLGMFYLEVFFEVTIMCYF